MEKLPSSRVSRVGSMKSRKSVGFNNHLKPQKRQLADQQGTSSISVNKEAGKLEDRLNYYHLVQLNELFKTGDKNGRGKTVMEFKEALELVLDCDESGQEAVTMFMKIDTNSEGYVNWDKFCTHMLLAYQERDMMSEENQPPYPFPLVNIQSPHKQDMSRITYLSVGKKTQYDRHSKDGKYITVSKEGRVCFWKSDLTLQRSELLEFRNPKMAWITDMVVLADEHKMVFSSIDNSLVTYDISAANFEKVFKIVGFPFPITTMDYCNQPHQNILVLGDTGGNIIIFKITPPFMGSFGTPPTAATVNQGEKDVSIPFSYYLTRPIDGLKCIFLKNVHNDWTERVRYYHTLDCIVSCSNDPNTAMYVITLHTTGNARGHYFQVPKGINSFDYSKDWNILVCGGVDTTIRLWNPFDYSKPVAVMKGHKTAIIYVEINDENKQIVSFSRDLELKVWNIKDQLCLQTFRNFNSLLPHIPTAFYLNHNNSVLLVASDKLGVVETKIGEEAINHKEVVSHEHLICDALYNEVFNQVVSGCHGSVITVWDLDTGEKSMQFTQAHGNAAITAMTFDLSGRRLITGAKDGSIKIWNFNNGSCVRCMQYFDHVEVTSIIVAKRIILAAGWNKRISLYTEFGLLLFRDDHLPDDVVPKYWGRQDHKEDILCLAYCEPNILISATYDGQIIVWDVDGEKKMIQMSAHDPASRKGSQIAMMSRHIRKKSMDAMMCHMKRKSTLTHNSITSDFSSLQGALSSSSKIGTSSDATITTTSYSPLSYLKSTLSTPPVMTPPVTPVNKTPEPGEQKQCGKWDKSNHSFTDRAVEKMLFLNERNISMESVNLVAVGSGGWVRFWNTNGCGLAAEFCVFDHHRRTKFLNKENESVTSCTTTYSDDLLFTGDSLGYIMVWDISSYSLCKFSDTIISYAPPLELLFRAHLLPVLSISLAEDKNVFITNGADQCIRLWTFTGRYLRTFGEKNSIKLVHPISVNSLPRRIPHDIHTGASYASLWITAGPVPSKWAIVKSLLKSLCPYGDSSNSHTETEGGQATTTQSQEDDVDLCNTSTILGNHYRRKTRVRPPMLPADLSHDFSKPLTIYSEVLYEDLDDTQQYYEFLSSTKQNRVTTQPSSNFPLLHVNST